MASCLASLGFTTQCHTDVSRNQMLQQWRAFVQTLQPLDVIVVYFSGHGLEDHGTNYLLPVDVVSALDDGLNFNNMLTCLNDVAHTTNVIILDACRENPSDKTWKSFGSSSAKGLTHAQVRRAGATAQFLVAFACEPGTVAIADQRARNSRFTASLLARITQPHHSVQELFQHVRGDVLRSTEGQQMPMDSCTIVTPFSFCEPSLPANAGKQPSLSQTPSLDPELAALLQQLSLQQFSAAFASEHVDLATAKLLEEADLERLGLTMGPHKKLLLALRTFPASEELAPRPSPHTATPPPPPAAAASAARPLGLEDLRCLPPRLDFFRLSAAVVLQGGVVVVEGDDGVQASRYDINKKVWTDLPDRPHKDNYGCSSCVLNGQLYLLGGGGSDEERSAVQCFDPVTNVWSAIANLPHTHDCCGAAVLDGCLHVCGGGRNVACYDPARKTWAAAAPMPVDVQYCSVVALADSIFVVVGDRSKSALVRYSPATRAWTELANLPLPRGGCAAVAFNGLLYVMGGRGDVAGEWSDVSDCWSYNPSTNIWTGIAPMPRSHGAFARAFVVHDCIWVVGGDRGDATITATFECYSPATNSWRP